MEDFKHMRKELNIPKKNMFYAYYNDCVVIKNDEEFEKIELEDGEVLYMSLFEIIECQWTYSVELLDGDCIFYPI